MVSPRSRPPAALRGAGYLISQPALCRISTNTYFAVTSGMKEAGILWLVEVKMLQTWGHVSSCPAREQGRGGIVGTVQMSSVPQGWKA